MEKKVGVGHYEPHPRTYDYVKNVLDTGRISYGPLCQELEYQFSYEHMSTHAVLSASGTDSLRAALHAASIYYQWQGPKQLEVVVPATTFVATVNIVTQLGLKPVFVDVEDDFYCMNPNLIEDALSLDTVCVLPVNLLGQPANLSAIEEIVFMHGRAVMIEDSAEAMFVRHNNRSVGSWGKIGCFSFYMAHLITAGVGGVAITDIPELAKLMRSLLNHGREPIYFSIDDDDDIETHEELERMVQGRFKFNHSGYSSRMTELQAAVALPQLEEWEDMLARRQAVASRLTAGLSRHADRLQLPTERQAGEHSYMMYGIRTRNESKHDLVLHLERHNIETRDMLPLVNQPVYRELLAYDEVKKNYPVSAALIDDGFYIGSHQGMSDADADYVCEVVDDFYSA